MIRHFLTVAWRNLTANKPQSAIAVFGLAVGLTAAILAGIVTLDAFTHDHFIVGHDRVYYVVQETHDTNGDHYGTMTSHDLAAYLRAFPGIDQVARECDCHGVLRHGGVMAEEKFAWADPDFFRIAPVPALYGDLASALARPDGLVISLAMARKYFGADDVVGRTLELNHVHPMTVRAVVADFPANASTNQDTVFGSSLASFSWMSQEAGEPGLRPGAVRDDVTTLVRLKPGASLAELDRRAAVLMERFALKSSPSRMSIHFVRSDTLNMSEGLHPGARGQLLVMEAVALVILVLACVNFVSLSVARSVQRGLEVAVRKAVGAARHMLMAQFLGEAVLQVLFALCLAIVLVEWSLPAVQAFLQSGAVFDYWRSPALAAVLLGSAVAVGLAAGAYPAFVLSSLKPAMVLKGSPRHAPGGAWLRWALTALQFAALIVLLISAVTIFRQNRYATTDALRVSTGRTLIIHMGYCDEALRERIATLAGVRGAACSSWFALSKGWGESALARDGGPSVDLAITPVDFGYLELYGLEPLAGRFFRREGGDAAAGALPGSGPVRYVVNEGALRRLGYASAAAAVGQPLKFQAVGSASAWPGAPKGASRFNGVIIGVVKDFSFAPETAAASAGTHAIPPAAYSIGPPAASISPLPMIIHVKLGSGDIAQTLRAIDEAWAQSGVLDPIDRQFLDVYVQDQDGAILKQGEAFAIFAGVAMLLACLGLFGIALSTTARRTREIGIRKAMGAGDGDILRLLLWQFAQPVLWANLIAWPLAWWGMQDWLSGFAYHVSPALWMFPAAGLAALLVALAAVSGQVLFVARQKPILALRYE